MGIAIATSPLTNTIYAGKTLKSGMWAASKQDVTMQCLHAVAEHVAASDNTLTIVNLVTGQPKYTLTVKYH